MTSFSVAKSFTSALIGMAIAEGHIGSVHDSITAYLPELAQRDPRFTEITIRHLLMMSSGIRYVETKFFNGDDSKIYYYPDLRHLALEQSRIEGPPGERFPYNNYHPLLLGMILERATGRAVADYLAEKIWQPMGAEYDGSWSLDGTGFEKMESGINGRAIDFARFGRLFLEGAEVDGRTVIPAGWVAESTQPDGTIDAASYYRDTESPAYLSGRRYYQYMWWGLQRGEGAHDFAALGNHGQFVYISPQQRIVIVRHGERYGVSAQEWLTLFYEAAGALPAAAP